MKYLKINKKDFIGQYKLVVDIKKSEPACMECLPPGSLNDHPALNGILIHSRIDCPPDKIYMINEEILK